MELNVVLASGPSGEPARGLRWFGFIILVQILVIELSHWACGSLCY